MNISLYIVLFISILMCGCTAEKNSVVPDIDTETEYTETATMEYEPISYTYQNHPVIWTYKNSEFETLKYATIELNDT